MKTFYTLFFLLTVTITTLDYLSQDEKKASHERFLQASKERMKKSTEQLNIELAPALNFLDNCHYGDCRKQHGPLISVLMDLNSSYSFFGCKEQSKAIYELEKLLRLKNKAAVKLSKEEKTAPPVTDYNALIAEKIATLQVPCELVHKRRSIWTLFDES